MPTPRLSVQMRKKQKEQSVLERGLVTFVTGTQNSTVSVLLNNGETVQAKVIIDAPLAVGDSVFVMRGDGEWLVSGVA